MNKSIEKYLRNIELELENANHHNQIELPRNLFDEITGFLDLTEEQEVDLARIISEEFDKNI